MEKLRRIGHGYAIHIDKSEERKENTAVITQWEWNMHFTLLKVMLE